MAPAIAHFLVGASLLLLLAAPLAVRYGPVRRHGIAVLTVGGLWGLFPDLHHVTPVYEEPLYAFHMSPWVDLFAFHYTLDLPPIREAGIGEIELPAVLVFLGAAAVFTLASEWGARGDFEPVEPRLEMVGGAAGAALVSTVLLGSLLHAGGSMGSVAAVVGRESLLAAWTTVGVGGVLAAGVFAACIELVTRDAVAVPASTAFGALVAVPTWLVTTVLVVPLWRMRVFDAPLELLAGDPGILAAFVLAGGALGATYATVTGALAGRGARREESPGRPIE
jgi:hypothetical protein